MTVIFPEPRARATSAALDTEQRLAPVAATYERMRARPLLVAVPLYRRADLARQVTRSILACADELAALGGQVVLYNDSPDDMALRAVLDEIARAGTFGPPIRVEANPANLGFVKTANRAIAEAVRLQHDLLLLNSDTVLTPGALREMARIALADPMIGFVNPRSNNATLATLPYQERFRHLPPQQARAAWAEIAPRLPPFSYTPTANGFCVLIRWVVLAEFGGFDEIYGRGYNEENDLAMRAGRRGYRAVLANHAFVWHQGSASFGLQHEEDDLERANREILLRRYPEYPRLTADYFSSAEQRAELLLGALIPDEGGRVDVALDFSSFVPAHNGTFAAGLQLLRTARRAWGERFNVYVLCAEDTYAFHDMATTGIERRDPHGPELYAAIFRVGQPYDWNAVERMALKGASLGVFMLDTISLDCSQLYDPEVRKLWTWSMEHMDLVAATSSLTYDQLTRRFRIGPGVQRVKSLHSLDLADYALPRAAAEDAVAPSGYVFVVGNHYAHKDVATTVNAIAAADPHRMVVVLSSAAEPAAPVDTGAFAPRELALADNVLRLPAGRLTPERMSALYEGAAVVVSPSHYEGFGMPVLNALAARKPVFVRPLPVVAELWEELDGEENIHVYMTTTDLLRALEDPPSWNAKGASSGRPGDALRAARDVGQALETMVQGVDYGRIVRRLSSLPRTPDVAAAPAPQTPQAFVARKVAGRVEQAFARVLALPGIFSALRVAVRALRKLGGRPHPRTA
jgi:GT2 family glycosyltransferase